MTGFEIRLARRPEGEPRPDDFERAPLEERAPRPGQAWVENRWLSLDPYMRGRMNAAPSYAPSQKLGEAMIGETVGVVLASGDGAPPAGAWVRGMGGWRTHWLAAAKDLVVLPESERPPELYLGPLGMPGLTAYAAWRRIARPQAGETVVVPAATGAVGSVAGPLAKAEGARVVGIAGGREKCAFARERLEFDACIDRRAADFGYRLAAACPNGVDVYLESVGGAVFDAVLELLNPGARVPLIGTIAHANQPPASTGVDRAPALLRRILVQRLRIEGLVVFDHEDLRDASVSRIAALIDEGRLPARFDVTEGLEGAPEALARMLRGENFGKTLIKIA